MVQEITSLYQILQKLHITYLILTLGQQTKSIANNLGRPLVRKIVKVWIEGK